MISFVALDFIANKAFFIFVPEDELEQRGDLGIDCLF